MSHANSTAAIALRAIIARIHGNYDAPELMDIGPLSESTDTDILHIAKAALAKTDEDNARTGVFTASESFGGFLDGMRANGTVLAGTNTQVAQLFCSALECLNPESEAAARDAENLAIDMEVIVQHLGGEPSYPDDDEDDFEDEAAEEDED